MRKVNKGWMPTKVDVDRLEQTFAIPAEGTVIALTAIAGVIGVAVRTHRFNTVVNTWRKKLFREHNMLSVGDGEGNIRFANPKERIEYASRKIVSGRRQIGRAIAVAYTTDANRLTANCQATRDQIIGMTEAKLRLAVKVMK